jgi:hypothetical protein
LNSTISAARLKLHELLVANLSQPGRQITFGPSGNDQEYEVISLFGVLDPSEEETDLPAAHKWETYVLEVGVKVFRPDAEDEMAQTVDTLGFAICDDIRGVIHGRDRNNDRTLDGALGGNGVASVISQTSQGVRPVHGGGWVIFLRLLIRCRARIA